MTALTAFLSEVRPFAPGVPDVVVTKYVRQAAIDFCERTRLWRFEDTYDVLASDGGEILTPSGSVFHDVEIVLFDGRELEPKTTRDLDRICPGWRQSTDASTPSYYTQIDQGTIKLVPAGDGEVYICVRLKPSDSANDLPEFLAREYRECLGWGALARILLVPGKPWTNEAKADYYGALFAARIDRLNTKGTTGQQNAPKRTRANFF